ncbi:MAG: M23 family metallopeptidase [Calothrix sp. SM1_7_51]|nr:M23 family metallopeptidase [Calothrix sp. SM1_7_51]
MARYCLSCCSHRLLSNEKGKFSQLRIYGLISLISFACVLLSTIYPVWTQALANFPGSQNSFAGSSLSWPARGIISQGFRKNRHEGIDIAGPVGTPIMAAAAGRVTKAGWDDWGLGNAIEIRHSNGSDTVYGHNQRLLVTKGEQVTPGQIIAYMGSTGNSSGPHLHFEYHPDGKIPVDPMSFLPNSVAGRTPSTQIARRYPINRVSTVNRGSIYSDRIPNNNNQNSTPQRQVMVEQQALPVGVQVESPVKSPFKIHFQQKFQHRFKYQYSHQPHRII